MTLALIYGTVNPNVAESVNNFVNGAKIDQIHAMGDMERQEDDTSQAHSAAPLQLVNQCRAASPFGLFRLCLERHQVTMHFFTSAAVGCALGSMTTLLRP
jgi:hypothetical protein